MQDDTRVAEAESGRANPRNASSSSLILEYVPTARRDWRRRLAERLPRGQRIIIK